MRPEDKHVLAYYWMEHLIDCGIPDTVNTRLLNLGREAMQRLSPRERLMIDGRFAKTLRPRKLSEVVRETGLTDDAVRYHYWRGIAKIAGIFVEERFYDVWVDSPGDYAGTVVSG